MILLIGGCSKPESKPSKMKPTCGKIETIDSRPGGYKNEFLIEENKITVKGQEPRKDNVWSAFGAVLPDARAGRKYRLSCNVSAKDAVMGMSVAVTKDWINRPYTDAGTYESKPFSFEFTPKDTPPFYWFIIEAPGEFVITDLIVEEL
jgi:hypothetical protein